MTQLQVSHEFIFWCTHQDEQKRDKDNNAPTGTKGDLLAPR